MRNKSLRACRAWESTYKKQNNLFRISDALVQGQIGLGHINPSVTSPNVSRTIAPNLAIIHQTWLKRMPRSGIKSNWVKSFLFKNIFLCYTSMLSTACYCFFCIMNKFCLFLHFYFILLHIYFKYFYIVLLLISFSVMNILKLRQLFMFKASFTALNCVFIYQLRIDRNTRR